MNVLVYTGPEVLTASLSHTLSTFCSLLLPNYTVQAVTKQSLADHPWSTACALLVFPSCRAVLSSAKAVHAVKSYVEDGGAYLGLSSGASLRGSRTGLEGSSDLGHQALRFEDKTAGVTIYPMFRSKDDASEWKPLQQGGNVYHDGWSEFSGVEEVGSTKILSRYADSEVAGVVCHTQNGGKAAFWSPSLEYPVTADIGSSLTSEEIKAAEQVRMTLLRDTLRELGLHLPEDKPPSCPLPQFLIAPTSRADIIPRVLSAIGVDMGSGSATLVDTNDTFAFHPFSAGLDQLREARVRSLEHTGEPDEANWQPKHVIVCTPTERPSSEHTPLFDVGKYFAALQRARAQEGLGADAAPEGEWGMGEALLYAEVVTSTQTMLDKNPRLLSNLPAPLLSLASRQLTGRGRGNNVWLSPLGSLPISLLIRPSLKEVPAQKLVFVQYLFSLAVTEACRDPAVLGQQYGAAVRIKWPNDVYAVVGGENRKIGGILVNTSFGSGKVEVVIGSGLNVMNARPTLSLAQLLPPESAANLSMEATTATILAKFDAMWRTFVEHGGSFEPFMDLYLERWLHSDQLVTVTSVSPPQNVRICGITPEHGLLRTIPERRAGGGMGVEYIDLQPDGNSFDLMQGLIKTKTY
ncbi:class II aaRS and biotin synthetase [Gloeophyllum trabeum ATCC 11539]|uniref:Class II aaRS and biotin synthetase n=1 Tax=Gloeophyllum trabeum (strain ATCC 11539 / FP-39264 / Madison 617) TaxID=670483 RepID=S7PWD3_GLOTA|nr:class II aaRS and biotin synthetase [Gloeophyllum trabeum ATCC 11539]EPQ51931.1 class II aaRS and biotin synthetase [Gloeophyllum trabeum ATCC 11539]